MSAAESVGDCSAVDTLSSFKDWEMQTIAWVAASTSMLSILGSAFVLLTYHLVCPLACPRIGRARAAILSGRAVRTELALVVWCDARATDAKRVVERVLLGCSVKRTLLGYADVWLSDAATRAINCASLNAHALLDFLLRPHGFRQLLRWGFRWPYKY